MMVPDGVGMVKLAKFGGIGCQRRREGVGVVAAVVVVVVVVVAVVVAVAVAVAVVGKWGGAVGVNGIFCTFAD